MSEAVDGQYAVLVRCGMLIVCVALQSIGAKGDFVGFLFDLLGPYIVASASHSAGIGDDLSGDDCTGPRIGSDDGEHDQYVLCARVRAASS